MAAAKRTKTKTKEKALPGPGSSSQVDRVQALLRVEPSFPRWLKRERATRLLPLFGQVTEWRRSRESPVNAVMIRK
ncbi:hypothetical protein HJFPF1_08887 [Paramyrothecium foliicola]|nr:hypothetical protein HJFPF1_08887 [Paramyrothecium foliicola]